MNTYECPACIRQFVVKDHLAVHQAATHPRLAALLAERDKARADADSYLSLIHQAISHHLEAHPDCTAWTTQVPA